MTPGEPGSVCAFCLVFTTGCAGGSSWAEVNDATKRSKMAESSPLQQRTVQIIISAALSLRNSASGKPQFGSDPWYLKREIATGLQNTATGFYRIQPGNWLQHPTGKQR